MATQGWATTVRRLVGWFNSGVIALSKAPVIGPVVGRKLTTISYRGRRSGRNFSTPVGYQRAGDVVTITVMFPDAKNWWRNFVDGGAAVTLDLEGADRTGHATAHRDSPRRVTITVQLDPAAG